MLKRFVAYSCLVFFFVVVTKFESKRLVGLPGLIRGKFVASGKVIYSSPNHAIWPTTYLGFFLMTDKSSLLSKSQVQYFTRKKVRLGV